MTPSLNKSFKFQSDWPYNNSQVYLLNSILEDLKEDEDRKFERKDDGYYFSSSVNYPNNRSLVSQNVYIDKNGKIQKVEVVDKEDNVQIMMNFKTIEFDKKFDKNYFELSSILKMNDNSSKAESSKNGVSENDTSESSNEETNTDTNTNNNTNSNDNSNTNQNASENTTNSGDTETANDNTKTTASIEDVVYPMYLPDNTYLTSKETIATENGERLILTFGGDSSFILVEEVVNYDENGLIIPVSGEFDFLSDVIGVIGTNSLTWHSNGIEYYMASDTIETSELVEIARSVSVLPVSK